MTVKTHSVRCELVVRLLWCAPNVRSLRFFARNVERRALWAHRASGVQVRTARLIVVVFCHCLLALAALTRLRTTATLGSSRTIAFMVFAAVLFLISFEFNISLAFVIWSRIVGVLETDSVRTTQLTWSL